VAVKPQRPPWRGWSRSARRASGRTRRLHRRHRLGPSLDPGVEV